MIPVDADCAARTDLPFLRPVDFLGGGVGDGRGAGGGVAVGDGAGAMAAAASSVSLHSTGPGPGIMPSGVSDVATGFVAGVGPGEGAAVGAGVRPGGGLSGMGNAPPRASSGPEGVTVTEAVCPVDGGRTGSPPGAGEGSLPGGGAKGSR